MTILENQLSELQWKHIRHFKSEFVQKGHYHDAWIFIIPHNIPKQSFVVTQKNEILFLFVLSEQMLCDFFA